MNQPISTHHWYALKVFYNRVFQLEMQLHEMGIKTYVPIKTVERIHNGVKHLMRQPAVASLLFMQCCEEQAEEIRIKLRGVAMLYTDPENRKPTAIPDSEMQLFIFVSSQSSNDLEYFGEVPAEWHTGERVRVTEGVFKGAEGRIKRIRGDHRLVITIEGVVAVATTYIPARFLERIKQ